MTTKTFVVHVALEFQAEFPDDARALANAIIKHGSDRTDNPMRITQLTEVRIGSVEDIAALAALKEELKDLEKLKAECRHFDGDE